MPNDTPSALPGEPEIDWDDDEAVARAAYNDKLVFSASNGRVISMDKFNGKQVILGENWQEARANDHRVKWFEREHNPKFAAASAHQASPSPEGVAPMRDCFCGPGECYMQQGGAALREGYACKVIKKATSSHPPDEAKSVRADEAAERMSYIDELHPEDGPHEIARGLYFDFAYKDAENKPYLQEWHFTRKIVRLVHNVVDATIERLSTMPHPPSSVGPEGDQFDPATAVCSRLVTVLAVGEPATVRMEECGCGYHRDRYYVHGIEGHYVRAEDYDRLLVIYRALLNTEKRPSLASEGEPQRPKPIVATNADGIGINFYYATAADEYITALEASRAAALKENASLKEQMARAGVGDYKADYFLGKLTETGELRMALRQAGEGGWTPTSVAMPPIEHEVLVLHEDNGAQIQTEARRTQHHSDYFFSETANEYLLNVVCWREKFPLPGRCAGGKDVSGK